MARYPAETPSFALKPYGAAEDDWDEAKRQAREVLYEWAAVPKFGTYFELRDRVTAIQWLDGEAFGAQIGWMLGQLSLEELSRDEDRPLLSSLVIGKDEGMPTHGYWQFLHDLGERVPIGDMNKLHAWYAEWQAACDFYGPRARQV
jgi:hypothetical protein